MRAFPEPAAQIQVSVRGGYEPVWAHRGQELFYTGGGNMMSVEVLPGSDFVTGEPQVLFSIQEYASSGSHQQYDVTPDGQRFVMIRNRGTGERTLVENFFEELKAKVGNYGRSKTIGDKQGQFTTTRQSRKKRKGDRRSDLPFGYQLARASLVCLQCAVLIVIQWDSSGKRPVA